MQLDKTRIAIRHRGWVERLDLALHVLRSLIGPLSLALAAGALPMLLFNAWLLAGAVNLDREPGWYVFGLLVLTALEAPLATAPVTIYLGKTMFYERPRAAHVASDLARALPQLFVYQVLLRLLTLLPIVTFFLPYASWPYLNEVILLERNPMRKRKDRPVSTMGRSSALHGGEWGNLLAQSFGAGCLAAALLTSLWLSGWFVRSVFTGEWEFSRLMLTAWLPCIAWIVAGYLAVVRFLGYLDLRTAREGWEVDLLMRAERARLLREIR